MSENPQQPEITGNIREEQTKVPFDGIPSQSHSPLQRNRSPFPHPKQMSRRRFFATTVAVTSAGIAGGLKANNIVNNYLNNQPSEIQASEQFVLERTYPDQSVTYMPSNPENILPQGISDNIYDALKLTERYPSTLDRNSFHTISQHIARLASLYYRPDKGKDRVTIDAAFYAFTKQFFQKILQCSDELEVDFVGTLLMWQTSGDNTSSPRAYQQDIRDEIIRMGIRLIDATLRQNPNLIALKSVGPISNLLGKDMLPFYDFATARFEGPVTLGIHDIETVMIGRGLRDLQKSLPDSWLAIASYLKNRSPRFFEQTFRYVDLYDRFDLLSHAIIHEIHTSQDVQQYLQQFYMRDKLRDFLLDGDQIDGYQYLRTTAFWAYLTDINSNITISGYDYMPLKNEQEALEKAIDYYIAQDNPSGFYLDQIANPKMVAHLQRDIDNGNVTAQKLLEQYITFHNMSDQIIAADAEIAAAITTDELEMDVDFQILTGVSYTRWLLHDAYKHIHREDRRSIVFEDPNELAYHAFLATANRESSPTYELAGTRPLDRATLTFLPPEKMFQTIDAYIKQVYNTIEPSNPQRDFDLFSYYFLNLIKERLFPPIIGGIHEYELSKDKRMKKFIEQSEKFGAYQNIITLPFSSWFRSFTATAGYIAKLNEKEVGDDRM